MSFFSIAPAIIFSHSGKLAGIILPQPTTLLASNVGAILGTILPQCWQRYTTTILANIVDQYWAIVGHKYWTDIGKTRCTILGTILPQYWQRYTTTILANVGHKYWTDIGKTCCTILAQHCAQYCSNIGIATHDNIG